MTFRFTIEAFSNYAEVLLYKSSQKYNIIMQKSLKDRSKCFDRARLFLLINSDSLKCN